MRFQGESPLRHETVRAAIAEEERMLGEAGRVLIRASGTEPVIRVMAEAEEEGVVEEVVARLARVIEARRA